ncbi:hypothetical protein [Streptomyces sp. NPDC088180]|uniref:hypothetical protein n=1 Tax=Streptomyces sp. NPDC088180 TaxID=3365837 RepID=UPI003811B625
MDSEDEPPQVRSARPTSSTVGSRCGGLALRTDELAIGYQAVLHIASVLIRVRC